MSLKVKNDNRCACNPPPSRERALNTVDLTVIQVQTSIFVKSQKTLILTNSRLQWRGVFEFMSLINVLQNNKM